MGKKSFMDRVAPCPISGCWIWLEGTKMIHNYEQPRMYFNKQARSAARVSWVLHHGEPPAGKHVLHTCHNSLCVAPHHLYLGDHAQNMRDTATSGRRGIGFDGLRKAIEMREAGKTNKEIAAYFGVHHKSISRAINGGKFPYFERKAG